jgi:hypothetical protein
MVLQVAGTCSFCGKDPREVFGIAGVVGEDTRICDECIGLCVDILAEQLEEQEKARLAATKPDSARPSTGDDELDRLMRSAGTSPDVDPREVIQRIQARLAPDPGARHIGNLGHCSFCDRSRRDVRKLITGPRVFICEDCTGDAGGLLAASGWRFGA